MKKIAITLLAVMLILCACSNQTDNKEGASQKGASSEVVTTQSGSTSKNGKASTADSDDIKDAETLPTVEDDGNEAGGVPFEISDGDESGKSTTKKKKKSSKEKTTKKSSDKTTSGDKGYELPKIPLG